MSLLLELGIGVVLGFNCSSNRCLRRREIPLQSFTHPLHLLRVGRGLDGISHEKITLLDFESQFLGSLQDFDVAILLVRQILWMELFLCLSLPIEFLHGLLLVCLWIQLDFVVLGLVLEIESRLFLVSLHPASRQVEVLSEFDALRVLRVQTRWPLISEGASCRTFSMPGPYVKLIKQWVIIEPGHRPSHTGGRHLPLVIVIQGFETF